MTSVESAKIINQIQESDFLYENEKEEQIRQIKQKENFSVTMFIGTIVLATIIELSAGLGFFMIIVLIITLVGQTPMPQQLYDFLLKLHLMNAGVKEFIFSGNFLLNCFIISVILITVSWILNTLARKVWKVLPYAGMVGVPGHIVRLSFGKRKEICRQ